MTTNLLDLLGQAVTPDLLGGLSKLLGESESALSSGVSALLPGLLGAMANKASTSEGASGLFAMVNDSRIEPNLAERLPTLVRSVQSTGLLALGGSLLSGLFGGGREQALGSALASTSGIRAASAGSLAAAVTPMVFSLIKRIVGERSLDPKGLATLLLGQRDFLRGKLDPGLLTAMGLGSPAGLLDGLGTAASRLTGVATGAAGAVGAGAAAAGGAATAAARTGASGIGRFLPWVIGAAVVLYLLSQLSNCSGTPTETRALPPAASTSTPATTPAAPASSATSTSPATGATAATAPATASQGPAGHGSGASETTAHGAAGHGTAGPTTTGQAPAGGAAASPSVSATAGAATAAGAAGAAGASGASVASGASGTAATDATAATLPARVYFETGSAEIGPKGHETIAAVARLVAAGSPARVDLTGLTDRTGDLAINEALSKRRADAVRAALVAAGVPEANVSMKPPMFVEAGHAGADAEARRVEISPAE